MKKKPKTRRTRRAIKSRTHNELESKDARKLGDLTTRLPAPYMAQLARLAEDIWRLSRRAGRKGGGDWLEPILERLNDDLREMGVEMIDRTGTQYLDGEIIEVLHSDVPNGWHGAVIVSETVSPTVRIDGRVYAPGKVILGPNGPSEGSQGDAR